MHSPPITSGLLVIGGEWSLSSSLSLVSRPLICPGHRSDLLPAHPPGCVCLCLCACVEADEDTMRPNDFPSCEMREQCALTEGDKRGKRRRERERGGGGVGWGMDSWFAHLAVNQLFDVPKINRIIYSVGGGSDEVKVTEALSLCSERPPHWAFRPCEF